METEIAGAGWYHDPDSPNILRWWDGAAWTEARMPVPAHRGEGDPVMTVALGIIMAVLILGLVIGMAVTWG